MNKEQIKILIPIIRKNYPKMIAKQIAGVQPMTAGAGALFNIGNEWSMWRPTVSFWPRRSITGKLIFGWINKRSKTIWSNSPTVSKFGNISSIDAIRKIRVREFATNRELFTAKLKGET